jgi:putative ABC transport system permease protein
MKGVTRQVDGGEGFVRHASADRIASPVEATAFSEQTLETVRQVPGVRTAALTSQLPLSGDMDEYGAGFEPRPSDPAFRNNVFLYAVSPGYVESMRIPLRRGRPIEAGDRGDAPHVALISGSLARRRFPAADPIGRVVRLGPMDDRSSFTIVGIVGDVKQLSLAGSESDAVYISASQSWFVDDRMSLVVRTSGDPAALTPAIRQAVWSVDKDQAVVRVATMEALMAATAAERQFLLILFEAFALAALVLAAAGIYGILAGTVAERTREIGVRCVLGASRGMIGGLVLRQGLTLTAGGVAIGLTGAAVASRALVGVLFGVSRLDPVTYLGVVTLLMAVAVLACGVPAWRAARVDPAITLKTE